MRTNHNSEVYKKMASFAKVEKQAHKLAVEMYRDGEIASLGTQRNYESCLKTFGEWLKWELREDKVSLRDLTIEQAQNYLKERAEQVGQKTLDQDRQALQKLLHHTGKLDEKTNLAVIKADKQQDLHSRAYTAEQVKAIQEHQSDRNALATELAYKCGLRAHELLTIQKAELQKADNRIDQKNNDKLFHNEKFRGREGERYTVVGKGGLCREISVPKELADRLEQRKLSEPIITTDRKVKYEQHYDIGGGNKWSSSFNRASNEVCSWSNGAHGLRHSYAQERVSELQRKENGDHSYEESKAIVSLEMGHFRENITETYLR